MEIDANKNRVFYLNLKNTSDKPFFLVLEPGAYYEDINIGDSLKLTVSTNSEDNLQNFFHLEYGKEQLSIFLNYHFSLNIYYNVKVEVNNYVIFDYQI